MCPICGSKLTEKYYLAENIGVCESLYICENCKLYSEQFAYGGYETRIGNFVIYSSHNDSKEDKQRNARLEKIIADDFGKSQ